MDILSTPLTLLIITSIFMLIVIMGLFNPTPEKQPFTFLKAIGQAVLDVIKAVAKLGASILGLFAESAKTDNDDANIAPSGGVLNYRTGKLDDGTDPNGWYEKD